MIAATPSAAQPRCGNAVRTVCPRPALRPGWRYAAGRLHRAARCAGNSVCRPASKSSGSSGSERAELQLPAQQAVFGPLAYQLSQPEWYYAVYTVVALAALLAAALLAVLYLAPQLGLAMDRVYEAARCLTLQPQVSCAGKEHDLQACAAACWW